MRGVGGFGVFCFFWKGGEKMVSNKVFTWMTIVFGFGKGSGKMKNLPKPGRNPACGLKNPPQTEPEDQALYRVHSGALFLLLRHRLW